jgi:hypothetical protein
MPCQCSLSAHRILPILKLLLQCAAALAVSCGAVSFTLLPIYAQNFVNDPSGTFTNNVGAVLRMRTPRGEIQNANSDPKLVRNFGIIELTGEENRFTGFAPLGSTAAFRIGSLVRYTSSTASLTQSVQARFYSNLTLDGTSQKRVSSGVAIGGDSLTTGFLVATGGTRTYFGTLFFDNTGEQTILGDERYSTIEIQRGVQPKRITGDVATLDAFRQHRSNGAGLRITGTLTLGTNGEFPRTDNGQGIIEIGTTANLRTSAPGAAALNVGSRPCTFGVREVNVIAGSLNTRFAHSLILVQTGASLNLLAPVRPQPGSTFGTLRLATASDTLRVGGTFTNSLVSGTNAYYHPQSTVVYAAEATQAIVHTVRSHPYGHLRLENGNKYAVSQFADVNNAQTQGTVVLVGNMTQQSSVFDVHGGTASQRSELIVLNPASRLILTGLAEVRGSVRRVMADTVRAYTFGNTATSFTRTGGSSPREMALTLLPEAAPQQFTKETDVQRTVLWSWQNGDSAITRDWTGMLTLGYRTSEIAPPFVTSNERALGFYATNEQAARRLATTGVSRTPARQNAFGSVTCEGLTSESSAVTGVQNGTSLLLRGVFETARSVQSGRWSNPATWSILREPEADDSVEIQHTVHVGFRRNALDGNSAEGQRRERATSVPGKLAATAKVRSSNGALLFGSVAGEFADEVRPDSAWQLGTISVEAAQSGTTTATRADFDAFRGSTTAHSYAGVVIFEASTAASASAANALPNALQCATLRNDGAIVNGGVLDISGTCASIGQIWNGGIVILNGSQNVITQESIAGWTRFAGDVQAQAQQIPRLAYQRLAFAGRSPKRIASVPRPFVVTDTLWASPAARVEFAPTTNAILEARGNVAFNGTLHSADNDALLQMNGSERQLLSGGGAIDGLLIENANGVVMTNTGTQVLTLRSRLDLLRGSLGNLTTPSTAQLRFSDSLTITRFPESSLQSRPMFAGNVVVRTRGATAMEATRELPDSNAAQILTLDIHNAGGYTLTTSATVRDSVIVSSRIFAETTNARHMLTMLNGSINPAFAEDSAEIVGTVRRIFTAQNVDIALFNNRYASLQALRGGLPGDVRMRVLPGTFPRSPEGSFEDNTKIRRRIEIQGLDTTRLIRIGYAWRVPTPSQPDENETNSLESNRVVLQQQMVAAWQTVGIPLRSSIRAAWNRPSPSGAWQLGVADSVRLGSRSQNFALGIDSLVTVLPTVFLTVRAVLEGAYLSESAGTRGSMKSLLRDEGVVPNVFDDVEMLRLADTTASPFAFKPEPVPLPRDAVDWMLLELRSTTVSDSAYRFFIPTLLLTNGTLVGTDGRTPLQFTLPDDTAFAARRFSLWLYHRNHLPVRSLNAFSFTPRSRITLDFTDAESVAAGSPSLKRLNAGTSEKPLYGLLAGDVSMENGFINRMDYDAGFDAAWNRMFGEGYRRADANMDGIVTTRDLNRTWNNRLRRKQ